MLRPLFLLAIIVALAVGAAAQPANAQEEDGIVAIDCDGATAGIQDSCVYDTGETFLIRFHIVEAPADGYDGFELHVSWTVPQLAFRPSAELDGEFLEPGCATAGRSNRWIVSFQPRPDVAFVCLNPPGSNIRLAEGVPFEIEFTCWAEGTGTLYSGPEHHSLLWLRGADLAPVDQFSPLTNDASVTCRPKNGQLGDVDCGGAVDNLDAVLLLQFSAGLLESLDCDYKGDMTQNGRLDSRDALLILQVEAGLIDRLPLVQP